MRYVIGLDVGIGSVGWAAVRCDAPERILDFGVRVFESGELKDGKDRTSQERRRYRSARRLVRRRAHRKHRIKSHLENIGLVRIAKVEEYFRNGGNNIIALRVKGLSEKLLPEELAACLINYCNKRGYQDFYEVEDETQLTADEKKDRAGAQYLDSLMEAGNYRTIAEMIANDPEFEGTGEFRSYRNNDFKEQKIQINRRYLREECALLLSTQSEFYPQLTKQNIESAIKIIFEQRCFEDGPGADSDGFRRYSSFLDTYGKCRFFPTEDRGCRLTVLADIFALVNVLSQYKYFNAEGKDCFSGVIAAEMLDYALQNGNIAVKDIKKICKKHGVTVSTHTESKDTIAKCLKYIKIIKPIFDACGIDWNEAISHDYRDIDSPLNKLGICLSQNITPRKRLQELKKFVWVNEQLCSRLSKQKFSGTTNVSYKHMVGAIDAFLQGEIYGKHQAELIKKQEEEIKRSENASYKLPSFEAQKDEFEFYKNPVVCRAINETRKIINAIISRYGSPYAINLEVASELNRCFDDRQALLKSNKDNEKQRSNARAAINKILGKDESDKVSEAQIERYRLGEQQGWKCLYSGADIIPEVALAENNRSYEVDHIIPYSLILDNTLQNKALVLYNENQIKRQRTPLMYMNEAKAAEFIGRVKDLYEHKKISKKKYDYLLQPELHSDIIDEWKSRNINDTRYITKFLVRYLKENLIFNDEVDEKYRRVEVYAVKSAITSRFRRWWLNEKTWGQDEKSNLKEITLLDHAADAVVIACCIPAYVEIAMVQNKLRTIFNKEKRETDEYRSIKENCLNTMKIYHGMSAGVVLPLLEMKKRTPCLIPNLREEVDVRFIEPHTFRHFGNEEEKAMTDEEIMARYRIKCREIYPDDIEFADRLQPVIVSHKPNRKAQGTITKDKAISIKMIDGEPCQLSHTPILALKKSQLKNIYSGDGEMLQMLNELLEPMKADATVLDALKAQGKEQFVTPSGRKINRVMLKSKPQGRILIKDLPGGGTTTLDATSYYCIELYKDSKDNLQMRGITYGELVRKDGKLWLSEKSKLPEDYCKHEMYLQKWDYIEVTDKNGSKKFSGYYVSVFNINENRLCYALDNTATLPKKAITISKKDKIVKYEIDILGKKGGDIKCGEPLLSITERN